MKEGDHAYCKKTLFEFEEGKYYLIKQINIHSVYVYCHWFNINNGLCYSTDFDKIFCTEQELRQLKLKKLQC